MRTTHRVQPGECMLSVAERYGFFWETLWDLPENAALRERRRDPTVLLEGDEVTIPEKTVKDYVRPTGASHVFKLKNVPAKLNLRLLDAAGQPRAGISFVLTTDGRETHGVTDGEGYVRASLHPTAHRGTLRIGESEVYELNLGALDPVDTVRGAQARMASLGLLSGAASGEVTIEYTAALRAFQRAQGLRETGELDASTQAALREAHRS